MSDRLEKNRPFSAAKKFIRAKIKLDSVTEDNERVKPQFKGTEKPFADIMLRKNTTAEKVAHTEGGRYPWASKRVSYSKITHKQSKYRR